MSIFDLLLVIKCVFVSAVNIEEHCSSSHSIVLEANLDGYITELQFRQACLTPNKALDMRVKDGQVMNVSIINIHRSFINDQIYGTIKDKAAIKEVVIGSGPREKYLLQSASNELELRLTQNEESQNRFMLHITGITHY